VIFLRVKFALALLVYGVQLEEVNKCSQLHSNTQLWYNIREHTVS